MEVVRPPCGWVAWPNLIQISMGIGQCVNGIGWDEQWLGWAGWLGNAIGLGHRRIEWLGWAIGLDWAMDAPSDLSDTSHCARPRAEPHPFGWLGQ